MKRFVIILFCLFVGIGIKAQRHYPEVSALEASFGNNFFAGNYNPFWNIGFSRYISGKAYYRIGGNLMKTTVVSSSSGAGWLSSQWFIDGNYYRTLYSNNSDFFFSLGAGAFLGTEKWFASDKLMLGVVGGFESEYFLLPRYTLILSGKEYFSPLSNVRRVNTVFSLGIKYLLY